MLPTLFSFETDSSRIDFFFERMFPKFPIACFHFLSAGTLICLAYKTQARLAQQFQVRSVCRQRQSTDITAKKPV
jgi:hypothetical protein